MLHPSAPTQEEKPMSSSSPLPVPTFFNDHEARTVDALAHRIIPGDERDPGAREAGAVVYIDRSLAGAYDNLQPLYQGGIHELDGLCRERHGARFVELSEEQQDAVLTELDVVTEAQPTEFGAEPEQSPGTLTDARQARLSYFVAVVHEHVLQGTFCDPVYGGNRGAVGWKLVGFPGAHWGYTEHQGELGFDATAIPIKTLEDLRTERASIDAKEPR
jgi:gluconate 2-dehydrogenase gamma chain